MKIKKLFIISSFLSAAFALGALYSKYTPTEQGMTDHSSTHSTAPVEPSPQSNAHTELLNAKTNFAHAAKIANDLVRAVNFNNNILQVIVTDFNGFPIRDLNQSCPNTNEKCAGQIQLRNAILNTLAGMPPGILDFIMVKPVFFVHQRFMTTDEFNSAFNQTITDEEVDTYFADRGVIKKTFGSTSRLGGYYQALNRSIHISLSIADYSKKQTIYRYFTIDTIRLTTAHEIAHLILDTSPLNPAPEQAPPTAEEFHLLYSHKDHVIRFMEAFRDSYIREINNAIKSQEEKVRESIAGYILPGYNDLDGYGTETPRDENGTVREAMAEIIAVALTGIGLDKYQTLLPDTMAAVREFLKNYQRTYRGQAIESFIVMGEYIMYVPRPGGNTRPIFQVYYPSQNPR